MRLELRFVNVILDAFIRCDANQVVAERAAGLFRGDDVFEFDAFESRVLVPGEIAECLYVAGEPELAIVEFFKKFLSHCITPFIFCAPQNALRLYPNSILTLLA